MTSTTPIRLFTPGPLTTSPTVKQAMLQDLGSRDTVFINAVKSIRSKLLTIANVDESTHSAVLMQGSGTFGIESVISSALPKNGRLLVVANGAYGQRIRQMAQIHNIEHKLMDCDETDIPKLALVDQSIEHYKPTHVAIVHCETTTGIVNPITSIAELCKKHNATFLVDAMSSFGGIPIDLKTLPIDFLISSSNKCLQGVPGFSFVIAKRDALNRCEGQARSLALDLHAQWSGLEKDGQFRFTPPTHAILAFDQALRELDEEGGVTQRHARFKNNQRLLLEGMNELGFKPLLSADLRGPIITSFLYPDNESFQFESFYKALNERGCVIYPGKVSKKPCFRIGHIGHLFAEDINYLVTSVRQVVDALGIRTNA